MPNIELHGYPQKDAIAVRNKVRTVLETLSYADEVVTTIVPSRVANLKGRRMPFLRVITTPDELPDLKKRLAPLGEDIEVIPLGEWIPKE